LPDPGREIVGERHVHRAADDEAEHLGLRTGIGEASAGRGVAGVEHPERSDRADRIVSQHGAMKLRDVVARQIGFAKRDAR
jgi:hypothetical protein